VPDIRIAVIHFGPDFFKAFDRLPKPIQELAKKKDTVFLANPFDPRLKTHRLKGPLAGTWSYSINYSYRVLFRFLKHDEVMYYDIGTHEIYR